MNIRGWKPYLSQFEMAVLLTDHGFTQTIGKPMFPEAGANGREVCYDKTIGDVRCSVQFRSDGYAAATFHLKGENPLGAADIAKEGNAAASTCVVMPGAVLQFLLDHRFILAEPPAGQMRFCDVMSILMKRKMRDVYLQVHLSADDGIVPIRIIRDAAIQLLNNSQHEPGDLIHAYWDNGGHSLYIGNNGEESD